VAGNGDVMIKIEGLHKEFRTKSNTIRALCDINFAIMKGEIFGIIGTSGAGKSTLVRCMNLLERPTSGRVFVDGEDMCLKSGGELSLARRSMGMIFQQFNLLMQRTALSNVCFPLEIAGVPKGPARKRALELLELVGLSDRAYAYPSKLSGGQKQRVAIARALANNPKVLLCDEATSALDPETTASILALLKDINRGLGITIVIITHEMSVVEEICQRVAIVDKGRLIEVSNVTDVFAKPRSPAARKLVYPAENAPGSGRSVRLRIVFDGQSSFEPVISNMVLACNAPVNILFADTKNISGQAFGQMVVELPEGEDKRGLITEYLDGLRLTYEEVRDDV